MFLDHYGLQEQPFGVTPDPRFLYSSKTHQEALASLVYGLEASRGFLTLIAPPGMGKTTLIFHLLEGLRGIAHTAYLFQAQCDSREIFRYLLSDLGIDAGDQNLARMHEQVNEVLLNNARAGKRFILVIDEAQNFEDSLLETVRLLSGFETPQSKLMQIVLAGQPQLADKLSRPGLAQLRQRIAMVSRLQPFTPAETAVYIHHRLYVAGHRKDSLFTQSALGLIAVQSGGIPRTINNLCFNALSLGFARGYRRIDSTTVREVLSGLNMGLLGTVKDAGHQFSPIQFSVTESPWEP
jgi:general secretion pathway protein A